MGREKDMEFKLGQTTLNMWVSGKITKPMAEEFYIIQMETSMMVNGLMIKLVGLVLTLIATELSTLENGSRISNGAEENRFGLIEKSTKENTKEVLKTV